VLNNNRTVVNTGLTRKQRMRLKEKFFRALYFNEVVSSDIPQNNRSEQRFIQERKLISSGM
jgi:hypothetical protein